MIAKSECLILLCLPLPLNKHECMFISMSLYSNAFVEIQAYMQACTNHVCILQITVISRKIGLSQLTNKYENIFLFIYRYSFLLSFCTKLYLFFSIFNYKNVNLHYRDRQSEDTQ